MCSTTRIITCILLLLCLQQLARANPSPTHIFSPSKSSSFNKNLFTSHPDFSNSYADDSTISGYVGKDVVQWGSNSATVYFGCASERDTTGTWDSDGILGLGLEQTSSSVLSTPYFYSLCDSNPSFACVFSLYLTDTGGEIQLGGYNPKSLSGSTVTYAPVTTPCCDDVSYQVSVTEIRIQSSRGQSKTLYSAPRSNVDMVTIVDSGISCTLLPVSVTSGSSGNVNVYTQAMSFLAANPDASLYFKIAGVEFSVPISGNCMLSSGSNELGLGDPFFREYLVVHDLSDRDAPRLGFGKKNSTYKPSTSMLSNASIRSARDLKHAFATMQDNAAEVTDNQVSTLPLFKSQTKSKRVEGVPATTPDRNTYYTAISIGTPRQSPFIVQVDTGSSLTAVFTESGSPTPGWQIALFVIAMVLIFVGLIAGCFFFVRRRYSKKPDVREYQLMMPE